MLKEFYNHLASTYDQGNLDYESQQLFPYGDYHELLDAMTEYLLSHQHLDQMKILDLGIGTAELYTHIEPSRIELTGIDFSKNMLEIAKLKVPTARYFEHDFLCGLPEELAHDKYDFIISTYTIEHLNLEQLIELIHSYLNHLAPYGKIILGDVLFLDDKDKKMTYQKYRESWLSDLHFHVYNQLVERIKEHLALSYLKITETCGMIVIENYHELSLQYEDNLVQYKSNTMKWKSTLSRKKRE